MALNNAKVFVDDDLFVSFDTSGTANNVITIGPLEYGISASSTTITNGVYCSFKGEQLNQVLESDLDTADSEDSFAYVTLPAGKNYIKYAVSKTEVTDLDSAKKCVRGMLIDYQLATLTTAGTCKDPLYEVSTYLSDGTLVSPTVACSIADVVRKIQALEANLDVNEAGYYVHKVRIALVQK